MPSSVLATVVPGVARTLDHPAPEQAWWDRVRARLGW
jgi:hypothetical protein